MNSPALPRPRGRQREVLYLPPNGHTVVLGTAGSGKTTLAILRSLYLSDPTTDHGDKTLLVTFNKCLVTYMKHLAGNLRRNIVVENYHHFARGYLSRRGKLPWNSINDPDDRTRCIEGALRQAQDDGLVVRSCGGQSRSSTKSSSGSSSIASQRRGTMLPRNALGEQHLGWQGQSARCFSRSTSGI